jgi:glycosyltransferase involved in cell wall biosynthesis
MDIALITEATYPYHPGGVSVWCDQLIRGMAPHRFEVFAIAGGYESPIWPLPENVRELRTVPIWGASNGRGTTRPDRHFVGIFEQLVAGLDDPDGRGLIGALRQMFDYAQRGQLGSQLRSAVCLDIVLNAMHDTFPRGRPGGSSPPPGSVADALCALDLLEHFLRPLSEPAPHADVCHAAANGLAVLTALTAQWTRGTPFVLTEHGVYLRERYLELGAGRYPHAVRWFLLRFFKQLTSAGYQIATYVAPGSEYNRIWEVANGADPARIRPIHNGIDVADFPSAPEEPDGPALSFLGRIDPLKDVETLLRAFREVHQRIPSACLRLFGPTPRGNEEYRDRCLRLHEELGLGESAVFEGRVPSVVTAYKSGQVFVMTSISEGFPYALIEAMAVGRPAVATAVGGCAEAVGDTGIIVPPRDPEAVAAACVELLCDRDRRRDMGLAARRRILSLFTVDQCLGLYSDLYRDATGSAVSAQVVNYNQHGTQVVSPWGGPA